MGCVSSTLFNQHDDFPRIGVASSSSLGHHIVSLTSTTYGILTTLDPPTNTTTTPTPVPRFTLASLFQGPLPEPTSLLGPESLPEPEVINSWELMAGLDSTADSFRFSSLQFNRNENSNPNLLDRDQILTVSKPVPFVYSYNQLQEASFRTNSQQAAVIPNSTPSINFLLDKFEKLCPPKGADKIVIYTTTLRGVRKTFEECTAVRTAIQGLGIAVCERDISMDKSFREELRELMKGKEITQLVPPRVFVRGRYLGGAEEVMRIVEDGCLAELLAGLPKVKVGHVCEGCGDVRFLPCFSCNGSCKMVMEMEEDHKDQAQVRSLLVRCPDCNENGLVLCPICS